MRRRLLLAILLAVAVTACALGIPLGYAALKAIESVTRQDLDANAQQIATVIDDDLANGQEIDLSHFRAAVPSGGRVIVTAASLGTVSYGPDPGQGAITERVPILHRGSVTLTVPADALRTKQTQVAVFVGLLVVLSVGVGAVVSIITARRLAKPLRELADRAAQLGGGDFRPDDTRYRMQELDMVAQTLDASATALARLVQRERDLVGDVSHQLRSRLTALQLRLEGLAEHPDEDIAAEAGAAMEQAENLATVLGELLAASSAARAVGAESIELDTELAAIVEDWTKPFAAQERSLRLRVPDGLLVRATPARLREAIGVLLDNALRHGKGTVGVSARRGDATVVIEVSDEGTGVPDELVPHVFERGVSGSGSTGVGLALARALLDADGGRLELSTARPATFAVFLPSPRASRTADRLGPPLWSTESSPR